MLSRRRAILEEIIITLMNPQNDQPPASSSGPQFVNYGAQPVSFPASPTPPPTSNVPQQQFRGPTVPLSVPPARHSHWLIVLILVILIVIVGGWATYAFVLDPGTSLQTSIHNIDASQKLHGNVSISIDSNVPSLANSTLSVTSDVVKHPPGAPDTGLLIDISSPSLSATGEIRFIGGTTVYGKITRMPVQSAAQASTFMNTWYSLSLDSLKSLGGTYNVNVDAAVADRPASLGALFEKLSLAGVFVDAKLSSLGMEGGSLVRRYTVNVDKEALAKSMYSGTSTGALGQYGAQMNIVVQSFMSSITFSPVEITTDLFSGSLRSITSTVSADMQGKYIRVHVQVDYDGNAPISVEAPTGATPMDDYVRQSLSVARNKGVQARIMANVSQTRAVSELYYSTSNSYKGVCTSTGNMQAIVNDIQTSSGTSVTCRDSSSAFLMAAKLPNIGTSTDLYYCVDSTGLTRTVSKLPAGMTCK